jgi:hypothetical protein
MKLLRFVFSLIVIVGLLAGCKKPPEPTPTSVPTATEPAMPAAPTATPMPGAPYPGLPTPTVEPALPYPGLPTPASPYPTG